MRRISDEPTSWPLGSRPRDGFIGYSSRSRRFKWLAVKALLVLVLIGASAAFFAGLIDDGFMAGSNGTPAGIAAGPVEVVTFSPDGKTLASCGLDGTVMLWDVARLRDGSVVEPEVLRHDSERVAMVFSPDSATLVAAGINSLAIWTRQAGAFKNVRMEQGTTQRTLAFSPDGRTLALGGDDDMVRIWDMPSGHERARLRGHMDVVRSLSFSNDGTRLVSTGQDRLVILWDVVAGAPIRRIGGAGANPVQFAVYSPDGRTIAVGEPSASPQDIVLYDADTGDLRTRLTGHLLGINALSFADDGRTLASAGNDGNIKIWNVLTGKEISNLSEDVGFVKSIAFSRDGSWLAFAGRDSVVRIRDLKNEVSLRIGSPTPMATHIGKSVAPRPASSHHRGV